LSGRFLNPGVNNYRYCTAWFQMRAPEERVVHDDGRPCDKRSPRRRHQPKEAPDHG
jgi:hypothetical protein